MLEILDPGCGGKLLASKLANDEIPQERFDNLRQFIDSLTEQQEASDSQDEFLEESAMKENFIDNEAEDDDIEVFIQCLVSSIWLVEVMQFKPTVENDMF